MTKRKERILAAVVEDYIDTASPVSSSEIRTAYLPDCSSATIRNELAALEEMGYLSQPHTSAGRVPTAEGYRLYVKQLMPRKKLTAAELKVIRSNFSVRMTEIGEVLKQTAKVISEVTHYTSLAYAADISDAVVENIKIVKLSGTRALVVIVTSAGVLKDAEINLHSDIDDAYFDTASRFVTGIFYNRRISEIMNPVEVVKVAVYEYKQFFDAVIEILKNYWHEGKNELVLEGASRFFDFPEYNDINKARAIMTVLDARDRLHGLISGDESIRMNIEIGTDPETKRPLNDCAVITATYNVSGAEARAGVIGPLRMDYGKVLSVLDYIGKLLNSPVACLPEINADDK
ncbi:MAG: heat-inducible transcriptional repressor HrcA [Firmicutes bacterium]|nr:heat-inducible transcriptional repressor HrcA [Bacillota bacterium]